MPSPDEQAPRAKVRALEKAATVFDYLAHAGPTSMSDLARGLDAPTSSVHRTLTTLVGEGWLIQTTDKRYALSSSLWETGVRSLEYVHPNLLELASLAAQVAAAEIREAVSLAIPCGMDTLFIGRVSPPNPNPLYIPVALRQPAYCNASGKVMLAFDDEATVEAICARGLAPVTENTITDPETLRDELLEARRSAVAFNRGEMNADRRGLAVPVLASDGRPAAAIGSSLPADRYTDEFAHRAIAVLQEHASHLSTALGYRGSAFRKDRFA